MECFFCQAPIEEDDKKFYLGIEKPYVNVLFHRECFKSMSIDDLLTFLKSNYKRLLNYRTTYERKRRRRWRR